MSQTIDDQQLSRLRWIGRRLILLGVSVWAVWLIVKATGGDPQVEHYLPFHLGGVLPGSIMARWSSVRKIFRRG
ncbi:MAG: hypothetical protein P1T08_02760 [Acidimicrobiia bacterium]|nr:hypothetical protein [Acidimicrobiia bacterium]